MLVAAPVMAQTTGVCRFDTATLAFAGTHAEQAECLLQRVDRSGVLTPRPLPETLRQLLESGGKPSLAMRAAAIRALPADYRGEALARVLDPASRTEGGAPALYFVIHDTSTPFLRERPFPRDLDRDPEVNDFAVYERPEPVAHLFVNRTGQIWQGHDLSRPWRATKLETRIAGVPSRGRFLHVELVQPRRYGPGPTSDKGTVAPRPGFSRAQYRLLAALYVHASGRAGRWLVPAFHATVDAGIPDAHDDPQNFNLKRFVRELERLLGDD